MADDIVKRALWEDVHERIRDRILSGDFAPGDRLNETELAEAFGTSRGPVREALRELARGGLVVELPRRGMIVSTLHDHDLAEVYGVREALELAASRAVIDDASDEEIADLARHLDAFEGSREGYLERAGHDIAFHRGLVGLAGNGRMWEIHEQMLRQTMLLLRTVAERRPTLRSRMDSAIHRDILDALANRDKVAAAQAIDRHYRHAIERLLGA